MDRVIKKAAKKIAAMKPEEQKATIQAMSTEGVNFPVAFDSLLDGTPLYESEGVQNRYKTYSGQVIETYRKYGGNSEYGNAQVRLIVDVRSAFIVGEGISVSLGEGLGNRDAYSELFDKFMKKNRLKSNRLFDLSRTLEMSGYCIAKIIPSIKDENRIPLFGTVSDYAGKKYYDPVLVDKLFPYEIAHFLVGKNGETDNREKFAASNTIYFRTGGYGVRSTGPTTKVGIVLTDCENYDRAVKDMRELNYRTARVTPDFETKNSQETKQVTEMLKSKKWTFGKARVGTAKFDYKTPGNGAHVNLEMEVKTELKTISGVTGVPVHWAGFVDMMSNRATAKELYAMINNATIMERNEIVAGLEEAFKEMQRVYINTGGDLISEVTEDFEIRLPLIDLGEFEGMVKAYSQLYMDEVISMKTYRNIVPGIDPLFEEKQIEEETGPEVTKSDVDPEDLIDNEDPESEEDDGRQEE